jgi:hypothetical protein
MANTPKRKIPKSLGPFMDRTDAEIEQLSIVTPADIEAAQVFVRAHAPVVAALLDAKPIEDSGKETP